MRYNKNGTILRKIAIYLRRMPPFFLSSQLNYIGNVVGVYLIPIKTEKSVMIYNISAHIKPLNTVKITNFVNTKL